MTEPAGRARALALAAGLLAACDQSPPQIVSSERFVLIEHMQVAGSCAEEGGAASPVRYAGYVDRWRDTQKSQELLQGSVTALERFREPAGQRTQTPYFIQFGDVGAPKIEGKRIVLKALADGTRQAAPTCTLDITRRERPGGGPLPINPRNVVSLAALAIGVVAGIRLVRHQARRTTAPLLLGLALLLQLLAILLP
ncbi:MAG TPA: hypothetical protein VIA61_05685 [Methylomirabilota bacterium]